MTFDSPRSASVRRADVIYIVSQKKSPLLYVPAAHERIFTRDHWCRQVPLQRTAPFTVLERLELQWSGLWNDM
jgi:hypothetical protein